MTRKIQQIRQGLEEIAQSGDHQVYEIFDGVIESVDTDNYQVGIRINGDGDDSLVIPDVTLRAASDGTRPGFIQVPTVGSKVIYARIEGASDYVLLKTSGLDRIIIDVAVKLELNAPETVFNSGGNYGIPLSKNVSDRLNILERDIMKIKQIFSSWVPVSQDGGAALKAAAATWFSDILQETLYTDIENEKIKQ